MTITITETDAVNGLRSAVASRGASYIYQGPPGFSLNVCVYVWEVDGHLQPMCIVGHALNSLGVPLRLMNGCANDESVGSLAVELRKHGYDITRDALEVFAAAQHVQDHAAVDLIPLGTCKGCEINGVVTDTTWGAALKAAVNKATILTAGRNAATNIAAEQFITDVEQLIAGHATRELVAA